MKTSLPLSLIAASVLTLAGCEKCSGAKDSAVSSPTAAPAAPDTTAQAPAAATPAAAATPGTDTAAATQPAAGAGGPATADNGTLQITDIKVGTGAEAVDGKKVSVHYTGTLLDGTKFDSSKDRGTPFPFVLGSGMVIAGWEQGVKGMKEGGVRKLVVPPALAYGNRAVGGVIPPNSTLVFEIELLKVE